MPNHDPDLPDVAPEHDGSDVVVAVLAAGHGTRMRSSIPKHLHRVAGVPIVERVIRAGIGSGVRQTIVMVSSAMAGLDHTLGMPGRFTTIEQGPPRGTADSVRQALDVAGDVSWLISLLGDSPLLTADTVKALLDQARSSTSKLTLLTCIVEDASAYGRIERDDKGRVSRIVEFKNDDPRERQGPTEINSGIMVLDAKWASDTLRVLPEDPTTGEYLLTDLVDLAVQQADRHTGSWPIDALIADPSVSLGVNDRVQLAEVDTIARRQVRERHMHAGVTIIGPDTVFIDEDVTIGADTIIHPNTVLTGAVVIGERCEIGPSAVLEHAQVGNDVVIDQSTVRNSTVGDRSSIGPYAHVRGGCQIEKHVHVGSYAEMKNARLADGAKCGHVSYLGDVTVGIGANIGAGTITANYDGTHKHQTSIGAGAFVGSDSVLVAPVDIGERARTGAGSVVTRDVPPDSTVMGVPARPRRSVDITDSSTTGGGE